ncbi:hypothetical protein ASPWEDRAFT_24851 [Aspergillus wentii DTO 134E9]|uniref:Myb-like domain-containing protein n=1 Tax=Aspergillus wentii DTO 134E9 TaxID=1073089 RepID=A0A1L9RVK2_ASPWE|nr:uncharacterized protein ASPWEDRAFT_24851 [Aspergillus wentii DTO 134E9]KAI9928874.1 hypothetical protein MW887_002097 [Aspergillus wentii]OJJ38981.1 hypothetical protein ASPWEDRAFT_24851 [Aspergillus wentii DTO 134E9]
MSMGHGGAGPGEGMEQFYENLQPHWTGVDTSPFVAVSNPYCTGPYQPGAGAILTPISLPDSSFVQTRPSPVLSHHSQQDFQYNIRDSIPVHGLGITAPLPSDFPRTVTAGLNYGLEDLEYGMHTQSPQPPPAKRQRRTSKPTPPVRDTPVSILPHPDGLQRLEQERRHEPVEVPPPQQRPRAPGRGRKDPQAEEEDTYVERLREQNFAWKAIREMFRERFHKDATEARLQMRMLRRRKERLARWDENDIQLLIRARDCWEQDKYHFIAQKMKELGAKRTYSPQQCESQLQMLDSPDQGHDPDPDPVPIPPPPRIHDPQHSRRRAALKSARRTKEATEK